MKNKKIAILGLGVENREMLKYLLSENLDCEIVVCDFRKENELGEFYDYFKKYKNIDWNLGFSFNKYLEVFDFLFRSPGWPINCPGIQKAVSAGVKLHSPMKLFFDLSPTKNIIGVTGTKGKGTTASLICEILKKEGRRTFIGGNIGVAPFAFFKKLKRNDSVVMELSSFQLEDMDISPRIAVFTNFSKEHLAPADPANPNHHSNMKSYWAAKANIFRHQKKSAKLIVNHKMKARIEKEKINGKIIYFKKSELASNLVGEHNKENIAAAEETAKLLRIRKNIIEKALKSFEGLSFRTEFVSEVDGVKYYNDSFATTPESAITALKSFEAPIVLLAGGADKGASFASFAKEIKKRVKFVILFKGRGGEKIEQELKKQKYNSANIKKAASMKEAFVFAKKHAEKGDVVLLSTACASFGIFKNYKERGELFNKEVHSL